MILLLEMELASLRSLVAASAFAFSASGQDSIVRGLQTGWIQRRKKNGELLGVRI